MKDADSWITVPEEDQAKLFISKTYFTVVRKMFANSFHTFINFSSDTLDTKEYP